MIWMLSLIWGMACSLQKDSSTPKDSASNGVEFATCEEAREAFLTYKEELLLDTVLRSCSHADECVSISCTDYCGVSCSSFHSNETYYGEIRQKLYAFALENCDVCSDYEYELYPEPEMPPPDCIGGECTY